MDPVQQVRQSTLGCHSYDLLLILKLEDAKLTKGAKHTDLLFLRLLVSLNNRDQVLHFGAKQPRRLELTLQLLVFAGKL